MARTLPSELPVFTRYYDLFVWSFKRSEGFPKVLRPTLTQRFSETGVDLCGAFGALWEGTERAPDRGRWAYQFLYDRAMTIAGGTSEVQRNIVAQRVLGLPRGS